MADQKQQWILEVSAVAAGSGTQAIDQQTKALEQSTAAAQAAAKANQDLANTSNGPAATSAADKFIAGLKASKTEATGSTTAVNELAGSALPKLAGALGVAATAAVGMRAVFDQMLKDNEHLAKAFDNLKQTVTTVWSDLVREVTGSGEGLRGVFDKITEALGGETEAMKKLHEPLRETASLSEKAQSATEKLTKALKDQAQATREITDEVTTLNKARDIEIKKQRDLEDEALKAERLATEKDGNLDPEQKAAKLKELDARARQNKIDRANEDVGTSLDDENAKRELKRRDVAEKQRLLDEQEARVQAANRLARAKDQNEADEAAMVKAREAWLNTPKGDPNKAQAEKAFDEAQVQANRSRSELKGARSDAQEQFGDTPYNDPKAETEALQQAREARDQAVNELKATEEKFSQAVLEHEVKLDEVQKQQIEEDQRRLEEQQQAREQSDAPESTPAAPAPSTEAPAGRAPAPSGGGGRDGGSEGSGDFDWQQVADIRRRLKAGDEVSEEEMQYLQEAHVYYVERTRGGGRSRSSGGRSPRGDTGGGGGGANNATRTTRRFSNTAGSGPEPGVVQSREVDDQSPRIGVNVGNNTDAMKDKAADPTPRARSLVVSSRTTDGPMHGVQVGLDSPAAHSMAENSQVLVDAYRRMVNTMRDHTRAVVGATEPLYEASRASQIKLGQIGAKSKTMARSLSQLRNDEAAP